MKKLFYLLYLLPIMFTACSNEPVNPCENVTCLNDGYCENGTCVCPEGYTGADCSKEVTPDRVNLIMLSVTRFPSTHDNGGGWDLLDGPDIYVVIYDENETVIWESNYIEDAKTSNVYDFLPDISFTDTNSRYTIRLYDYDDFDSDDFMGGIEFPGYVKNLGFPSQYNVDANGDVAFEFTVNYYW